MEIILEGHMILKVILICILTCLIEFARSIVFFRHYLGQNSKVEEGEER